MHTRILLHLLSLCLLPALSGVARAQSMTVISGNQGAQSCFMAATLAAQMHYATRNDIRTCTLSLEHDELTPRDRLATLVNRGILYVALNDVKRALRDYEEAQSMQPRTGEVYVNRGNLYFVGNDFGKAISEYDQALDLGLSKEHVAYFNRAMAHEHLGDLASAEQDYLRAIDLSPQWAIPQARLDALRRKAERSADP